MSLKSKSYYLFLRITNSFNLIFATKSEFSIIVQLINNLDIKKPLSIAELAEMSHVSEATVSRFIRKLGFSNYQDFSINFYKSLEIAQLIRSEKYNRINTLQEIEKTKNDAIQNIEATYKTIDVTILTHIVTSIKQSENCIFIGTQDNISHFTRFQRDLIANSISSFIFYDSLSKIKFLKLANENTCAIFVILSDEYLNIYKDSIQSLREKKATIILISQECSENTKDLFDIVYLYGEAKASRYGEYSLEFIAKVLSILFYQSK